MAVETSTDLGVFFGMGDWDEAATYYTPAGASTSCRVIVFRNVQKVDANSGDIIDGANRLYVRRSEVDAPVREGYFVVGSTTWRVNEVEKKDDNVVSMEVRED